MTHPPGAGRCTAGPVPGCGTDVGPLGRWRRRWVLGSGPGTPTALAGLIPTWRYLDVTRE